MERRTKKYIEELLTKGSDRVTGIVSQMEATDRELIKLMFQKRRSNAVAAGKELGYSSASTYRHLDKIYTRIALELGQIDIEAEDLKRTISDRTGIPSVLLTGSSSDELMKQAKAILEYKGGQEEQLATLEGIRSPPR